MRKIANKSTTVDAARDLLDQNIMTAKLDNVLMV
jgi:hypothetical protein